MRLSSQIYIFFGFSSFIFKRNHVVIYKENPSDKIVIIEGELHGTDRYEIGNLEDLLRLVCTCMKNLGILKYF